MAKQIYVNENGNPIEVSGTINTAELLPISGNDDTSTKEYIDTGLSGKATNDNYVVVKQTQISLSSAISVTAGQKSTLLSNEDITALGYSALDDISQMGTNYDLVGCLLTWSNNSSCIAVDTLVSSGNKVTMNVYAVTSQSVNAVRLLTWWKRK